MMIRTALSEAARARLVAFCAETIRADLDAARYADALEAEHDNWNEGPVVFEVRAMDARDRNPATITFSADADFRTEELE